MNNEIHKLGISGCAGMLIWGLTIIVLITIIIIRSLSGSRNSESQVITTGYEYSKEL